MFVKSIKHHFIQKTTLLLFLGLFALISCAPAQSGVEADEAGGDVAWVYHDTWSDNVHFPEWGLTRGRGVGFMRPEQRDVYPYDRDSIQKFETETKNFEIDLSLTSGIERESPVLISLFVNYEQVEFMLDGKVGLLHHVVLEPNQELEIPMSIAFENEGWHDVFVVAFYSPEKHPADAELRLPGSGIHLGGFRTVVCVKNCEKPDIIMTQYVGEPIEAVKLSGIRALLLSPGDEEPQRRLLPIATVEPNQDLAVELWARNLTDAERNYVVIPIHDFLQVPFKENGDDKMLFQMPPDSNLLVSGIIKGANDGFHEFLTITIIDPFQSLEGGNVVDPFVKSEMRTGIIVDG